MTPLYIKDEVRLALPTGNLRVHGNGFLQLDLAYGRRLHVFGDPRIPRQRVATPIHNHTFGFRSTVLTGEVRNHTYILEPREYAQDHVFRKYTYKYRAVTRKGADTELQLVNHDLFYARLKDVEAVSACQSYFQPEAEFHQTVNKGLTVTLIQKEAVNPSLEPIVLVPSNSVPDNDFCRDAHDAGLLLAILGTALEALIW